MRLVRCTAILAALVAAGFSQTASSPVPPAPDRAAVKRMFDPWRPAVPPRHLVANIYYVGAIGVSSFLITTPQGHILIDSGFEDTAPIIERGVQQLGYDLKDIKFLLSSHAHVDHVGGHAAVQRLTGARIVASAGDAQLMASGGRSDFIAFPPDTLVYEPIRADQIVKDGDTVKLGGVTLTAHVTPGHTKGATTWTMENVVDGRLRHVVFFSSASINPGTQLLDNRVYPEIADDLATTFAKLRALPCDIFFAPHGGQFAMAEKFAKLDRASSPNPFIDPAGWKTVLDGMEQRFRSQLASEKAARAEAR